MRNDSTDRTSLLYRLTRSMETLIEGKDILVKELLTEPRSRNLLVVKTRWILLSFFLLYSLYAGFVYHLGSLHFFLAAPEFTVLAAAVVLISLFNLLFRVFYQQISATESMEFFQILLDIFFVTVIIHFTGGAASWFWPVYLVVTIEACFLLDEPAKVWTMGGIGSALYGILLWSEYAGLVPSMEMPFTDSRTHNDPRYLVLIWFWVSLLNATVAVIGGFFMSSLRRNHLVQRENENRLVTFLESAHDLIHCTSPEGNFLYVNRSWQQSLGYSLEDLSYLSFLDVVDEGSRAHCRNELRKVLSGESTTIDAELVSREGRKVAVEGSITCSLRDGRPHEIWSICRDVTEKKQIQEQLRYMAHHDILTGLPNRMLFIDRLRQAKALAARLKTRAGILFVDLDRFKLINDSLGHVVGDRLLQEAAKRLLQCVREVDTVARVGGDEFVVILVNVAEKQDVETAAAKILQAISRPFVFDNHELFITASIGISVFPDHGEDPVALVKKADIAMYASKNRGRNTFHFYGHEMDEDGDRKLLLSTAIRKGVEAGEFLLLYQPKVDIASGRVVAVEALVRWQHPEMGLLPPGDFISLAEENGTILHLGEWVLRTACVQNRAWQDEGVPPVRVAVNLSGYQLQQKDLISLVRDVLEETGLEPHYLELEITETVIMQNPDFAVRVLSELREIGIHISIDDFGTGYSSLAHLKHFTVNTLKIDKSFVRDVEVNSTDAAIATAIISMGNSMNLRVIAEGVETKGQYEFLRQRKCDEMQGFLFSQPLPPEEVVHLIRQGAKTFPTP